MKDMLSRGKFDVKKADRLALLDVIVPAGYMDTANGLVTAAYPSVSFHRVRWLRLFRLRHRCRHFPTEVHRGRRFLQYRLWLAPTRFALVLERYPVHSTQKFSLLGDFF
jgi:hypothetical protein